MNSAETRRKYVQIILTMLGIVGAAWSILSPSVSVETRIVAFAATVIFPAGLYFAYSLGKRGAVNPGIGIRSITRRGDAEVPAKLKEWISSAKTDIYISGISLQKLQDYYDDILERAKAGVSVNLMLPDPEDVELVKRIGQMLERTEEYTREGDLFFTAIMKIWKQNPRKISVKTHHFFPTYSGSMFDRQRGAIEIPMFGWTTNQRLWIEIDFERSGGGFRENLLRLWDDKSNHLLTTEKEFVDKAAAAKRP